MENDIEGVSWSEFCTLGIAEISIDGEEWMVAAGNHITFSPIIPGEHTYTVLQSKAGFVDRKTDFTITVTLDCTSFLWQVVEDMPASVK